MDGGRGGEEGESLDGVRVGGYGIIFVVISVQDEGYGHGYACESDVGREALADASRHEEETHEPGQSGV